MISRRWFRWALRIGLGLLVAVCIGVGGLYAFVQSRAGLDLLAEWIGQGLSDESMTVRVGGLEGSLASSFVVRNISAVDQDGVFASIDRARLEWRPSALLGGRLDIESVSVGRLAIERVPSTEASSEPVSLETLSPGLGVRIGQLSVEDIVLAPPVLGQKQQLSAKASVRLEANLSGAAFDLSLVPADDTGGKAEISFDYAANPARFAARARIDEPVGGVISRIAGLPHGQRFLVDLTGDGPADNWRGKLSVESGRETTAAAALTIALRDGTVSAAMEGTAEIGDLVAAPLRSYLGQNVAFHAEVDFVPSDRLVVRRFTAETNGLTFSGAGALDIVNSQVSATVSARTSRPLSYADISIEQGSVDAKLDGGLEAPRATFAFQVAGVANGPVRVASVGGSFAIVPNEAGSFDIEGKAEAGAVDTGGLFPAELLGPTVDMTVAAVVQRDTSFQDVLITAASGSAAVEIAGAGDPIAQSVGRFSVRLDDIGPAMRTAGFALDGKLAAEGTFRFDASDLSMQVTSSGALEALAGGPANFVAALGKRVSFAGTGTWRNGAPLEVVGLEVVASVGRARSNGTYDLATGAVSGNIDIQIPKLEKLSSLAGAALAGQAAISAAVDGNPSALQASGQALLDKLFVETLPVGRIGVGYLANLEGEMLATALRLGGEVRNKALAGSLNARMEKGAIQLSEISLTLGKSRMTGQLDWTPAAKRVQGDMQVRLSDIGDLPGLETLGIAGSGEIRVASTPQRRDELVLTARMADVVWGRGTGNPSAAEKVTSRLTLKDIFTQPTLAGDIGIDNAAVAGVRRGQMSAQLQGDFSKIGWTLTGAVAHPYPASVTASGTAAYAAPVTRLSVRKMKGEIAGQAIELRAPFAVSAQPNAWRAEPVDFSLSGGRFQFSGSLIDGAVDANGRFDNLPIRLASLIDPRLRIDGTIDGVLQASGPVGSPSIMASLAAQKIRPLGMALEAFGGFTAVLRAEQKGDEAEATFEFSGPVDTKATAAVKTRSLLRFSPFALAMDSNATLNGELEAAGRLDLIDQLVGLGEDRLAGRLAANAKLSGTFAVPVVHGDVRLNEGFYEGAASGTVLRDIEAHISFTGERAQLVSLTAVDGGTGKLSGGGSVRFSEAGNPSGGVEIALDRFAALRHPFAGIDATGKMILTGSLQSPQIKGHLTVDNGEIRIPDALPETVVTLDVVEINGEAIGNGAGDKSAEPSAGAVISAGLDVDIVFPGQTFVRGRGLDSEWKGRLAVKGTTGAPIVGGKLDSVRGTFAFAGRTFVIKRGSVFFPGGGAIEPEIDALAEAKLSEIVARVEISGNIAKPSIDVSSEPSLPQEDVLAHILFGKTTGQLSAIQAAQLAQTAATLSGKGGAGIVDKVRQALGVDVLNVESSEGDTQGASLKAGKYLTEDVFLSVTQGTQPGSQKVGVEVQVLPNISVESNVSGNADSNIGVNWKWDY